MVIRQDGEGEQLSFAGGGLMTILASAEDTGGSMTMLDDRVVRGKTTPLHLHPDFDEAIYVLEGEILVHADGKEYEVRERGLMVAPRGVPHAFLVTSESARLLGVMVPGSGEDFYRDASDPADSVDDPENRPDFDRLRAAAERSPSIEILGPPPFATADSTASQ
jgi:quercetin dioxygenase-like cupin family protein